MFFFRIDFDEKKSIFILFIKSNDQTCIKIIWKS